MSYADVLIHRVQYPRVWIHSNHQCILAAQGRSEEPICSERRICEKGVSSLTKTG